LVGLRFL